MYRYIISIRSRLLVFLTHKMALPFLRLVRKPDRFPYDMHSLSVFEEGSLGKDLHDFLVRKNLDLLPYYARHDIKHILLQYDTTDEGEVCLQCFMLGNGHISFPVAATVIYGFVTMPEYWGHFRKSFKRGRDAVKISDWKWFSLLHTPTEELQNKIDSFLPQS